jgi:RNA polymerase sigma factor (sigma-70 family)
MRRFSATIAQVAHGRGFSAAELDELYQDVRIRLWHALEKAERIESVAASYVRATAVSAAVDFVRRRRARRTVELREPRDTAEMPLGPATRVAGVDQQFAREELAELLNRAVEQLASSRRVVVRLYLAGYARADIATLLGWGEAKTRNLLYRGLADLRAALAKCGVEPGRLE